VLSGTLALVLLVAACGDGGKKNRTDCSADAECSGGVCFASECYTACTSRDDCATDEVCVWRDSDDGQLSICITAAEQTGCTNDTSCEGLVRLAACEQAACLTDTGLCGVTPLAECTPEDQCGDGQCGPFENCADCADDCPCDGTCRTGVCHEGGGGGTTDDPFVPCNAGALSLTASEPDGLPFDAASLGHLGAFGMVGEDGDDVTVYLWLKDTAGRLEEAGGNAIVLLLTLPADAPTGGTLVPDGIAFVNGGGVTGVDAEWLEVDDERSSVTWTGPSLASGAELSGTVDLWLTTACGFGLHAPHLTASFTVTLQSVMEVVSANSNCLELLSAAFSFPTMNLGHLELTLDGTPVTFGTSQPVVALYPDGRSLNVSGYSDAVAAFSLSANDVGTAEQSATVSLNLQVGDSACYWELPGATDAVTLTLPDPDLLTGPVTGTFQATLPQMEGNAGSCTPATHEVSGSFTAAICR
jgi:hypothetical protein